MKKVIFAVAIAIAALTSSCGSGSTDSAGTDSTATVVDSSACCKDTADSAIPFDTTREDAGPKIDNPN